MRRRHLLLAAPALALCGRAGAQGLATQGLAARAFALPALPSGPLQALGALELDKAALGLGGLSGLHITDDLHLTAISDTGRWLTARLVLDATLVPQGLTNLASGPLRDGAGAPLPRGYAGDAEALARMPDGTWLVAFERWHRIRAYRDINGPGRFVEAPLDLAEAPGNGGLESMALLPDGRLLLIAESLALEPGSPAKRAWLGRPGLEWVRLGYQAERGMLPCDAVALPEGGALVLERSFSWLGGFGGRIAHLTAQQLAAPAEESVLAGTEWLRMESPLPTDNYEALALFNHGGRRLLAVLSDDNQNVLQRSLLLLFALRTT